MEKIGFGMLGAGMISGLHADAFRKSDKAYLAAICNMRPERAEVLRDKFAPEARLYTDFDAMLADPAVEAVSIVTPNHLHTEFVLKAAAAGKHVLCEKPPAMSLAETDEMIAACRRAGVKFGVFVQSRMREPMRYIKQALDAGRFGKVLRIDVQMKWYRDAGYYHMDAWRSNRRYGAGVTIQHAFHYLDLMQFLMGEGAQVSARMCNLAHPDVALEDTLDAEILFKNGVRGFVQASTALWPGNDVRLELYGTEGTAVMAGTAMGVWKFRDERPEDEAIRKSGSAAATAGGDPTALPSQDHQYVIDDCVDAIRANREVCIPCESVRGTLEIALGLYKADKEGGVVTLPLGDETAIWE